MGGDAEVRQRFPMAQRRRNPSSQFTRADAQQLKCTSMLLLRCTMLCCASNAAKKPQAESYCSSCSWRCDAGTSGGTVAASPLARPGPSCCATSRSGDASHPAARSAQTG
eukprot:5899290-Pyramimonas_sp.AAC.1